MKRQDILEVERYFKNLVRDAEEYLTEDSLCMSKDVQTLANIAKTRGMSFLTITLPSALAHLDRCIANGCYTPSGLPGFSRKSKADVRPRLFWALHANMFNNEGRLTTDFCVKSYRITRQILGGLKKLKLECAQERTIATVREFYSRNTAVRTPTCNWLDCQFSGSVRLTDLIDDRCDTTVPPVRSTEQELLDRQLLDSIQTLSDSFMGQTFRGWNSAKEVGYRHGPGAVSDINRYKILKYDVKNWSKRLELAFPMADVLFVNYSDWAGFASHRDTNWSWKERASKLVTVPKTQKGPRLIAAEPTSHMWCQQAVRSFLERSVKNSPLGEHICFENQFYNQELARIGSVDGSLATIDLSAASDSVSTWMVERLFRRAPALLKAMAACRTRFITQDLDLGSPALARIHMYSTMGNATTFPVQSIIFTMIALGSIKAYNLRNSDKVCLDNVAGYSPVRVFGDDIIVPSKVVPYLYRALALLGFSANEDKSFTVGNFRESCGKDYYKGIDVTVTYLSNLSWDACKRELDSTVAVSNNFYLSGYENVAELLKNVVNDDRIAVVDDDSYELAYIRYGEPTFKKVRYNRQLQRKEAEILVSPSLVSLSHTGTQGPLLQYFTEAPTPDLIWRSGLKGRPKAKLRLRWVPVR